MGSEDDDVPSSEVVLEVINLGLSYARRQVLRGVSLTLSPGESLAIRGRSGSGKSSLLTCILGLVRPSSGKVLLHGEEVRVGAWGKAARMRRDNIGMIFQGGELLGELSPTENLMIVGLLAGMPTEAARHRSIELLDELGVPRGAPSIGELSGGERQRVAVARALMNRPSLILADEPTGSLDPETRDHVVETLYALPGGHKCALVVVTHDPDVAAPADRVMWLEDGVLTAMASDDRSRSGMGAPS